MVMFLHFPVYMFERAGFHLARLQWERSLHCSRGRIDPSVLQRVLSRGTDSSGIPVILEDGEGMRFDLMRFQRAGWGRNILPSYPASANKIDLIRTPSITLQVDLNSFRILKMG